ncbi:diacylglycerol kinase [Marivirga tractuosa]|uniref:Diacylglycerol kinase n=1 Tax=Marivirga tractuosa (strain ATCC 23168 / DSM 4126 / NBRC 15989 / NCIMB 1408 / VKM B-1430 / H-43) TaxID=643867 RepID=E4TT08_MARTH|nr:diacylglycerol kinase family protein [Marivirga tractuosa]ADR20856.1 diacylglycerol kinase [Marivirga tractuosa DSM 4126]BDD14693.1 diacylglycerol kinase [Marivirga tractuosa]
MKKFIVGRLKSIKYVFVGMSRLLLTEHAIITQCIIGLFFLSISIYFNISRIEWMFLVFSIGLVLTVESLNTAIELTCNFINPDYNEKIGVIKDIAAGAVGFAVIFALINAFIIFYPYIVHF